MLKSEVFDSKEQLLGVLNTCDGYLLPGHQADGLRDTIFLKYGALEQQLDAAFDLELVRYLVRYTDTEYFDSDCGVEESGWLELTDLGKEFVDELQKRIEGNQNR